MSESVLNLGEKIVLASRLAAIEHVRQVIAEQDARQARLEHVHDADASTDAELQIARELLRDKWRGFFAHAKQEAA
jgi:hypothetical protein